MRKSKNQTNIKKTKKKVDKFFNFIAIHAITTWFCLIFPPIFILMGNNKISELLTVWGIVFGVMLAFLGILIFTYKRTRK